MIKITAENLNSKLRYHRNSLRDIHSPNSLTWWVLIQRKRGIFYLQNSILTQCLWHTPKVYFCTFDRWILNLNRNILNFEANLHKKLSWIWSLITFNLIRIKTVPDLRIRISLNLDSCVLQICQKYVWSIIILWLIWWNSLLLTLYPSHSLISWLLRINKYSISNLVINSNVSW